jgi:alanyl aminopeptidase
MGTTPPPSGEDPYSDVRPQVLTWLGAEGRDPEVRAFARTQTERYLADPSAVAPSITPAVLAVAASSGDRALYETYRQRFEAATRPADRALWLQALAGFRDEAVIDDVLAWSLSGPLRPQEVTAIANTLSQNLVAPDHVWRWLTAHHAAIRDRLPGPFRAFLPYVGLACSAERLAETKAFFGDPQHAVPGTERELAKVSDTITDCVALRTREGDAVATFLREGT